MRIVRITIHAMIICVCRRISDRDIARAVQGGCASFDELQFETGVATCCGVCHDCARDTFEALSQGGQSAPPTCAGAPSAAGVGASAPWALA